MNFDTQSVSSIAPERTICVFPWDPAGNGSKAIEHQQKPSQSEGESASIEPRVDAIFRQMTSDEKMDYIGGHNKFYIRGIPRLQVPELKMADGPLGVRNYGPSVSYPASICLAASWDPELANRYGEALAQDARARGVHVLLAPGMNICRAPMCGRNFEYFGEDPFLISRLIVAVIKGIQSQGVIATAKHIAGNNQEWNRYQVSSDIDERTLREIYLLAFEASVKEANVAAVMTSYNLLNGIYAGQNEHLFNDIVRKDWNFQGIVMSDWNAVYDGFQAAKVLDLEMPNAKYMNRETLLAAIKKGDISQEIIDEKVRRILRAAIKFGFFDREQTDATISLFNQEARKVALDTAQSGIVLLKNENAMLPLEKAKLQSIAVIGPRAQGAIPQGNGSSLVNPIVQSSFLSGLSNAIDSNTKIFYSPGVPDVSKLCEKNRFTLTPNGTEIGFEAEYFDNINLQGSSALKRKDPKVSFQWKELSYRPNGPVNHFSARWTGYFSPIGSGDNTFYLSGNDGFRLYVDDKKILEHWNDDTESFQWKTLQLEESKSYKIQIEYFGDKGAQAIEFGIAPGKNTYIDEAKKVASMADAVILCVGFDSVLEGECWDRSFKLPDAQDELIRAVTEANKKTVVVVTGGGNVDMSSWIDTTDALLHAWYPGQEGAEALADIIFGKVNPSGKLPVSFERKWEDNPAYLNYYDVNDNKRVEYKEGIFVGYRHYDKSDAKPRFAFGHGLSYTTFAYANLEAAPILSNGKQEVVISFDVTNTGKREGKEISQVYVSDAHSKVVRPIKELKGFSKVHLKPGETKKVVLTLDDRAFSYYDVQNKRWTMTPGNFQILVGSASDHIDLVARVALSNN